MRKLFFSLALMVMLAGCGIFGGNEEVEAVDATSATPAEVCSQMPAGADRARCFQDLAAAEMAAVPAQQRPAGVTLLATNHTSVRGQACAPVEATICFEWTPQNYDSAKVTAIQQFIGDLSVGARVQAPDGFVWSHGAEVPLSGSNPLPEGGQIYWWRNPAHQPS